MEYGVSLSGENLSIGEKLSIGTASRGNQLVSLHIFIFIRYNMLLFEF